MLFFFFLVAIVQHPRGRNCMEASVCFVLIMKYCLHSEQCPAIAGGGNCMGTSTFCIVIGSISYNLNIAILSVWVVFPQLLL